MAANSSRVFVSAVLALLLLSGCAFFSTSNKKGLCPSTAILANTSSLTTFRQDAQGDPAGELYTASMTDVKTDCEFDKQDYSTDSVLEVTFRATRPTGGDAAQYSIPYYVAVTDGDRILTKHIFVVQVAFAAGENSTKFTDTVASTQVAVDRGKKPNEYELLAGLQLTQAQMDYNKKMGRYAP